MVTPLQKKILSSKTRKSQRRIEGAVVQWYPSPLLWPGVLVALGIANSQAVHISQAPGITVPCSVPIKGHMETPGAVNR